MISSSPSGQSPPALLLICETFSLFLFYNAIAGFKHCISDTFAQEGYVDPGGAWHDIYPFDRAVNNPTDFTEYRKWLAANNYLTPSNIHRDAGLKEILDRQWAHAPEIAVGNGISCLVAYLILSIMKLPCTASICSQRRIWVTSLLIAAAPLLAIYIGVVHIIQHELHFSYDNLRFLPYSYQLLVTPLRWSEQLSITTAFRSHYCHHFVCDETSHFARQQNSGTEVLPVNASELLQMRVTCHACQDNCPSRHGFTVIASSTFPFSLLFIDFTDGSTAPIQSISIGGTGMYKLASASLQLFPCVCVMLESIILPAISTLAILHAFSCIGNLMHRQCNSVTMQTYDDLQSERIEYMLQGFDGFSRVQGYRDFFLNSSVVHGHSQYVISQYLRI